MDGLKGLGGIAASLDTIGRSTGALSAATSGLTRTQNDSTQAITSNTTALKTKAQAAKEAQAAAIALADTTRYSVGAMNQEVALFKAAAEAQVLYNQEASQTVSLMSEEAAALAAVTEAFAGLGANIDALIAENNEYNASILATAAAYEASQTAALFDEVLMNGLAAAATNAASANARLAETRALVNSVMGEGATSEAALAGAMDTEVAAFTAVSEAMAELGLNLDSLIAENDAYKASIQQLAAAHEEVSTAALFDEVLKQGLATAADNAANANVRLAETEALVAQVTSQSAAAMGARAAATGAATAATSGLVSGNVSAAASFGLLEGRTLSMNRAAANFATKVVGLGPILQAAFPVIGAIALISVIYQGVEAFDKWITKAKNAAHDIGVAFDTAINSIRKEADALDLTNAKLEATAARLEHKPTTNGLQIAVAQMREEVDRLDTSLERMNKEIDTILNKSRVGAIAGFFTGQAGTKDNEQFIRGQFDQIEKARSDAQEAIDKAQSSIKDPKQAEAAVAAVYENERKSIQGVVAALNDRYNALKKVNGADGASRKTIVGYDDLGNAISGDKRYDDQTANLTQLGKSARLASEELHFLDGTMLNIKENAKVDTLRDYNSGLKASAKEAALEWKSLEAAFTHYMLTISESGSKPTPTQALDFLHKYDDKINPINKPKLEAKELPFQNQVDGTKSIDSSIQKLQDRADRLNLYGDALKETTELDRISQEAQKKGVSLTQEQINKITALTAAIQAGAPLQQEETKLWKEARDAEDSYNTAVAASERVMADYPQYAEAIGRELNKLKIAHEDMLNPLNEFQRGLTNNKELLGQYGDQLEVSKRVQALAEEKRREGITNYREMAESQREAIAVEVQEQQVQKANAELYNKTIDAADRLKDARNALIASTREELSLEAQRSALLKNQTEQNDLKLNTKGEDTFGGYKKDVGGAALADYAKNFTTVAAGIKQTLQTTFATLADGFADSIGRAIVYAKDLGSALKDVARSALSELISGLVKVAIQMLIIKAAKKIFGEDDSNKNATEQVKTQALLATSSIAAMAAVTVAGMIAANLLSKAWWPVAEAVSLATFGVNAVGAGIGIAAVKGMGETAGKMATGGWVDGAGTGTSDSNLRWLSHGEFVVNAQAAQQHSGLLEAINSGGKPIQGTATAPGGSAAPSKGGMNVQVHNYAGARIETQQIDENTVRMIVHQEGPGIVQQHAPKVIAGEIANPNSHTSKALYRNVTPSRVR